MSEEEMSEKENNISSENISSENISSENVSSENVSSENVSSENVSSENVSSENVSSEENTTVFSDFSNTPLEKYEEPWSDDIEYLLVKWKEDLDKISEMHQYAGYIIKLRYYKLAIPNIIIPIVMALVSQNIKDSEKSSIAEGIMFTMTGILSGLQTFFNYGQLYEEHFQYSSRFSEMVKRIDSELARKRKFRTPADVFLTEVKCKIEYLTEVSPEMPINFFNFDFLTKWGEEF